MGWRRLCRLLRSIPFRWVCAVHVLVGCYTYARGCIMHAGATSRMLVVHIWLHTQQQKHKPPCNTHTEYHNTHTKHQHQSPKHNINHQPHIPTSTPLPNTYTRTAPGSGAGVDYPLHHRHPPRQQCCICVRPTAPQCCTDTRTQALGGGGCCGGDAGCSSCVCTHGAAVSVRVRWGCGCLDVGAV